MSHSLHASRMTILSSQQRLPAVATWAVAFAAVVTTWDTRRTTRKHLAKLPPHLMGDIGVDPLTAYQEAQKPFWVA